MVLPNPSKELLSEVFEENVISIDELIGHNLAFTSFDNMWYDEHTKHVFNTSEIKDKCIDWAYEEGFSINTGRTYRGYYYSVTRDDYFGFKQTEGVCETSFEAVIKAAEWVLNNGEFIK